MSVTPETLWQSIETAPINATVDVWCVYGAEEFAQHDGGASVGRLVTRLHKSPKYGWFGNQSNEGIPQGDAYDLVPVAWRVSATDCPAKLIASVLGIPLTREDAIAAIKDQDQ
jgi:hypothetical protein